MNLQIIDFQYFIMSIILLSNTNFIYFALRDIRANKKDHQSFIYKCLTFSLYTMLVSILIVFKFLIMDVSHYFFESTYQLLVVACTLFLVITGIVYWRVNRISQIRTAIWDWNIALTLFVTIAYTLNWIGNTDFLYLVFTAYSIVTLRFLYNVILLKKAKINFGLYFLLASYLVIAFVTLLGESLVFEITFTVHLALNVLIMYGLFLFYAQYYVEELDVTNKSLVLRSSDLETLNAEMKAMAYKDALTGLPNQVSFLSYLMDRQEKLTLFIVNVRNFSVFNQILGFNQGNELLRKMANQIQQLISADKVLFRLYNDKFIIAAHTMAPSEALSYSKEIRESFLYETTMNLKLDLVIGVTQLETQSIDYEVANAIIGALEVANLKAKTSDNGLYFLPFERYVSEKAQYNLEYHLRQAIDNNQIEVYYQPQFNAKTKCIHSYEALARWRLEGCYISPAVFIPLAESTGLISKLSYRITEAIFSSMSDLKWNKGRKVSINLSSIQLVESNFIANTMDLLNRYSVNPKEIVFEITETTLLYDLKKVEDTIRTIKQLGFEISLDDFGTGYSSLNRFSKLNFDEVKFDRFFVNDLQNDEKLRIVFSKTIELFNLFNMRIVVEGVENAEQESILDAFAIDVYQGYYYARPMSLEALLSFESEENKDEMLLHRQ